MPRMQCPFPHSVPVLPHPCEDRVPGFPQISIPTQGAPDEVDTVLRFRGMAWVTLYTPDRPPLTKVPCVFSLLLPLAGPNLLCTNMLQRFLSRL